MRQLKWLKVANPCGLTIQMRTEYNILFQRDTALPWLFDMAKRIINFGFELL